jgi:predicted RNA-binding protein (virulence factor B family)
MKPEELEGQLTFEVIKSMEFTLDNLLEVGFIDKHMILGKYQLFEYNHYQYLFVQKGDKYYAKLYLAKEGKIYGGANE